LKSLKSKVLVAVSVAVLVISLLGDLTSLGNNRNAEARKWERFEPSLTSRIRTLDDFGIEAEQRNPDFKQMNEKKKMTILYEVVIDRFCHGIARHNLFSNWILFGMSFIIPQTGTVWEPNLLVRKGNSIICSQTSDVLVQVAIRNGIPARSVGLNGHVVMEVWFENGWHCFDPDLEVVPIDPASGKIQSVEEASINEILLKKYYNGEKLDALHCFLTRKNNVVSTWKVEFLKKFEKILEILKYLLPASVILVVSYKNMRPKS
jgi:hypothetical protein